MPAASELPVLIVADSSAWGQWLKKQATTSTGVWLTLAKKGVTTPTSLTYAQALDEALCHGWIDGQARSIDDKTYSHRFQPRATKSIWSERNVGIVARLEQEGRMFPAGIAAVAAAKADGRWEKAYKGSANVEESPEFLAALKEVPEAVRMYEVLTRQNRYAIYWRLQQLKTEKGKKKRIQSFVEMLARGETVHPQKKRPEGEASIERNVETSEPGKATSTKKKAKRIASEDDEEAVPLEKRVKKGKVANTITTSETVTEPRRPGLRQKAR